MKEYDFNWGIMPINRQNCFEDDNYWTWCGSAVKGDDGKYYLFAARWSKQRPFFSGYVFSSEVVCAVADEMTGPFKYQYTVLPDRGEEYWDGRMTHNPTIHKFGDTYYLFYIGATYPGERPSPEELKLAHNPKQELAYSTVRIGLATAKSPLGPWKRADTPIFDVIPKGWDSNVVTNPAACFLSDGTIMLYYRSNTPQGCKLCVAKGNVSDMHFERVAGPLFAEHPNWSIEDVYVWYNGGNFEMIAKDISGDACGVNGGGVHFVSADGISWKPADNFVAYTRSHVFEDGSVRELYHFERPCVLIENGSPACLYVAVGEGGADALPHESASFAQMASSRNQAVKLR